MNNIEKYLIKFFDPVYPNYIPPLICVNEDYTVVYRDFNPDDPDDIGSCFRDLFGVLIFAGMYGVEEKNAFILKYREVLPHIDFENFFDEFLKCYDKFKRFETSIMNIELKKVIFSYFNRKCNELYININAF